MEKTHVSKDKVVFEVDGETFWQSGKRIVLPKYILEDGQKQNLIFNWHESLANIPTLSRNYVFSERLQSKVIELDLNDVDVLLDPRKTLQKFVRKELKNELSDKIVYVCSILDGFGIKSEDIGIGGSNLTGLTTKSSDIDLLIYGSKNRLKLVNNLDKLFSSRRIGSILSNEDVMDTLYQRRKLHFSSLDEVSLVKSEKRRVQGLVDDTRFVFAFIRESKPNYYNSIERIEPLVPIVLEGRISSATVPFEPLITHLRTEKVLSSIGNEESLLMNRPILCISHNPIYAIQYFVGEQVYVAGMLERVTSSIGDSFYQIGIRYHHDIPKEIKIIRDLGKSLC